MPEEKKKLARIPLPPKPATEIHSDVSTIVTGVNTSERLMAKALSPELRRSLAAHLNYYRELGIYDFYRRDRVAAVVTAGQAVETGAWTGNASPQPAELHIIAHLSAQPAQQLIEGCSCMS